MWWYTNEAKLGETQNYDPRLFTINDYRKLVAYVMAERQERWGQAVPERAISLSPSYIKTFVSIVKIMFNWAFDEHHIDSLPFNPREKLKFRNHEVKGNHSIDKEDILKLIAYAGEPERVKTFFGARNFAMLLFFVDSGVRIGEGYSIRLCDLDMNRRSCYVVGKTGKRQVFFSGATHEALSVYLQSFRVKMESSPMSFVWMTEDGFSISYHAARKIFESIRDATGIKFHPHTLRHAFASLMSDKVSIFELKNLMGHKSIKTTEGYVHTTPDTLAKAYLGRSPLTTLGVVSGSRRPGRPKKYQ
jgi:site-specific recombinase XerD